jgi:MFS family permease
MMLFQLLFLTKSIVGIIRTMVAEMVPEKELQPRAFSLMPLVWSLGSVVGPSFGGFLAEPADKFPGLFGKIEYFKRFPYALPNLVAMVFFLISASSAFLFLHVCYDRTSLKITDSAGD